MAVLVTSRVHLRLTDEREFPVLFLSLPETGDPGGVARSTATRCAAAGLRRGGEMWRSRRTARDAIVGRAIPVETQLQRELGQVGNSALAVRGRGHQSVLEAPDR